MIKKELFQKRIEVLLILLIFIILFIVIMKTPIIIRYSNEGNLIISEVMPVNTYTIKDINNRYSDYIEIYNGNDYDIDLTGYYLSDDSFDTKKWQFPDNTIIPKYSYLVIYASSNNLSETELHTNFKLDSSGEVVTLSNPKGKSISKIFYSESLADTSYGILDNEYVYFYNGTPGMGNNSEYSEGPIKKINSDISLLITEYIINNISSYKSKLGTYDSVIEIYNDEDNDIDLTGYYLTNNSNNLTKYKFPDDTIIKSKSYMVVVMSGANKIIDGEIHTNFELTNDDSIVILSDKYHNIINQVIINKLSNNISYGLYENSWHYYNYPTIGYKNTSNYIEELTSVKDIVINEVSALNPEAIELKNITNRDINLSCYSIGDKSGAILKFPNIMIKANGYLVIYGSDKYSYKNNKLYAGFHINNSTEVLYLYKDNILIQEFNVGRLTSGISTGLNENLEKVYYKQLTFNKANSKNTYWGYSPIASYSSNGGYIDKGSKISLDACSDCTIYYTLDGSWPSSKSIKYKEPILINKTTVIKTIVYRDNYLPSEITSRTYFVGRKHDLPIISISTNQASLDDLLINYFQEQEKKISFEYYESDGNLGVSFIGGTKLTGADSRKRDQKSMAIYLRKEYGLQEVTYPFFKDSDVVNYSSFTLRNSGEDPYGIRIQDTVLTYALKERMDIDMQDYRAVVVYLNGKYYGLYNMREKLNGDYLKSNYNLEDGEYDLIKYVTATAGSTKNYNKLLNYIRTHNTKDKKVYEYIKTQLDVQEFINYLIVESYYGNTDQGNIRYWKSKNGKWRFMLYDLDWSLWNTSLSMNYTVLNTKSPAVTNLYSVYDIARRLYKNSEFRDLYLSTLAYHLENTFNPKRMNLIVDELADEIREEIPYHIKRWPGMHSNTDNWEKNVKNFKNKLTNRYNYVVKNIKSQFNLTKKEYDKYFGSL